MSATYRLYVASGPPTRPMTWAELLWEIATLQAMRRGGGPSVAERLKPLRAERVDVSTTPGAMPGVDQKGSR